MLYHFLVNLLKTTKMTRYCMDQEGYTCIQEDDPTVEHFCGLNLWAMMHKKIWPQTKVSTINLETKLSEITFATCNTSALTLIKKRCWTSSIRLRQKKGLSTNPIAS
jgi:hypothetical protein